jgi:hypothetical protein
VATVAIAAIVAAPTSASALERIDLLLQAVEFLLGELTFAVGFLEGDNNAFEIAQDGFKAVPNAIDLSAQVAKDGTLAFVAASAAIPISVAVPVTLAPVVAAIITAVASTVSIALTPVIAATFRFAFTLAIFGMLAIRVGAFFVKFFGLVRFVGRGLRGSFAFRQFVHCWRNVLVLIARTIFTLAIFVFFAPARFLAIARFFRRRILARRPVVSTTAATTSWRPPSATAATASAAIAIAGIAFSARALAAAGS